MAANRSRQPVSVHSIVWARLITIIVLICIISLMIFAPSPGV
jgi:hypothetical protein